MHAAAGGDNVAMLQFLLAHRASVKVTNALGETALQIAQKSKPTSRDVISSLKVEALR